MITALYAGLCALLIVKLSLSVIALRRKHKVPLGDGNVPELQTAIRLQANATEYIPIALILILLLEMMNISVWLIHLVGIILIIGRVLHVMGLKNNDLSKRVLGMKVTLFLIIALAVLNIAYLAMGYFSVWSNV
ncbi:MAPEG family protein [Methylophaga sp. OBS3]|uniref:MAPEG family protein n=1 Tax=Methylophaga sp. OBS3 TaxID=2991934 RepID=UPI0022519BCA|nr:MAPEG family protein [Methylophaga sp. OBS3]MCX4190572.1 MAPEG family protein [Methylophaga sp. OBS3]